MQLVSCARTGTSAESSRAASVSAAIEKAREKGVSIVSPSEAQKQPHRTKSYSPEVVAFARTWKIASAGTNGRRAALLPTRSSAYGLLSVIITK